MSTELDKKFNVISSYEQQFAHTLAVSIIHQPKLNVWMFLVPIIFIYHANRLKRYKANLADFQQGFTRTKYHALSLAREELALGKPKQERDMDLFAEYDLEGPNIKKVRDRQLEEINLLFKHYRALFKASGDDYPQLVRSAYKSRQGFETFLNRLGQAEILVNKAALKAFHDTQDNAESRKVVSDMEKQAAIMRSDELKAIFGG